MFVIFVAKTSHQKIKTRNVAVLIVRLKMKRKIKQEFVRYVIKNINIKNRNKNTVLKNV